LWRFYEERLKKVKEYIWKTCVLQVTCFTMFLPCLPSLLSHQQRVYKTTAPFENRKRQELKGKYKSKYPIIVRLMPEALRNYGLPEKTLKHILYFRQSHFMMLEGRYVFYAYIFYYN